MEEKIPKSKTRRALFIVEFVFGLEISKSIEMLTFDYILVN